MGRRPAYTVLIKRSAEKEMDRLPRRSFSRLADAILRLEADVPRAVADAGPVPNGHYRIRRRGISARLPAL